MRTTIFIIAFIFSLTTIYGQTIPELEYDLSWTYGGQKDGAKIDVARKLQQVDPFNLKAADYICRYYEARKIDSVSIFFDNLIAKFSRNTEPFLLRTELLFLEMDYQEKDEYNRRRIKYLQQALVINPKDRSIISKLVEVYYRDFMFPLEKEKEWMRAFKLGNAVESALLDKPAPPKQSTFVHAADSSLKYLYQLWELDQGKREVIYYPIRQLECYLKHDGKSSIVNNFETNAAKCYFPAAYFANLTSNWKCDFTVDYLFDVESARSKAKWLERQLIDLKENCLSNSQFDSETTVYRFTWLRSFHHPIAIRLEHRRHKTVLYWKMGNGAGGYKPLGLKKSGKRNISTIKWTIFEGLVEKSKFVDLPNEFSVLKNDGATWTLEKKTRDSFKAYDTNQPDKEMRKACLYLLGLTNIRVKKDERY